TRSEDSYRSASYSLSLLLCLCTYLYDPAIVLSLAHHSTRPQRFLDWQARRLQGLGRPGVTRIEQAIIAGGQIKHAVPMIVTRTKGDGLAIGVSLVRGMDKAPKFL